MHQRVPELLRFINAKTLSLCTPLISYDHYGLLIALERFSFPFAYTIAYHGLRHSKQVASTFSSGLLLCFFIHVFLAWRYTLLPS
jgi:hypothetical protein